MIGRRRFLTGLTALAAPSVGRAQVRRAAVVGFVGLASEAGDRPTLAAFRKGLVDIGRPESPLLRIEARHTAGDVGRVGAIIAELAAIPVDVFLSPGQAVTRALRRATSIPIVAIGLPPAQSDPELFESLARPGGTITGFSSFGEEISAKRAELLELAIPGLKTVGILHNTSDPTFDSWGRRAAAEVSARGLRVRRLGLTSASPTELSRLILELKEAGGQAIIVVRDFLSTTMRDDICRIAIDAGIAIAAEPRDFAEAGALFSYGADIQDTFRRAAAYVDRVLNGEKAGELPIQLPSKFEMVLNQRTAKALGLTIPASMLARADEVIE